MTAHLLDDTFITAKEEFAKGSEFDPLIEGQSWEENICANPFRNPKFQGCHFNEAHKQISPMSTANGLDPAGKHGEWKLIDIKQLLCVSEPT